MAKTLLEQLPDTAKKPIGQQVVSKQRVADHGEVYTNPREVNAMLDFLWGLRSSNGAMVIGRTASC